MPHRIALLEEGDELRLLGIEFEVLHCPGHTPGHLVYFSKQMQFAFMGDVLFQGSIGRTDFAYGDHAALLQAIKDKILPLGDNVSFICGHGPGSTIGQERTKQSLFARASENVDRHITH